MSAPRVLKSPSDFFVVFIMCSVVFLGLFAQAPRCFGQEQLSGSVQVASPTQEHPDANAVAPLQDLLTEAEQNNPEIQSARQGWQAAKQVPSQVSTLPDPQFNVQQFSVGSPRPFAGYTNSDFAYVGLGVSQDFPYPGKLKLRGAVADGDADTAKAHVEVVLQDEIESLKTT